MHESQMENKAKAYIDAFESRNIEECMGFFSDSATLSFHTSHYSGKAEIESWHRDRFNADLRLIRIDGITVNGDSVLIEAVGTSKKLRNWRIDSISGAVEIQFEADKIRDLSFSVRLTPW